MAVELNTDNLVKLMEELAPKKRLRALKSGYRRAAKRVRDKAISHLREKMNSTKDLEKGIRSVVFKRRAGFCVTIGTTKGKTTKSGKYKPGAGYYLSRRRNTHGAGGRALEAYKKPVLIWAELGSKERMTKGNGGKRSLRLRSAHSTGRMPAYGFMDDTKPELTNVTEMLRSEVVRSYHEAAKKYGGK